MLGNQSITIKELIIFICTACVISMLYLLPIVMQWDSMVGKDYIDHANFAVDMYNAKSITLPHFLYQFLLLFVSRLLSIDLQLATYIMIFFMVFITTMILFYCFYNKMINVPIYIIICCVFIIMFSNPIAVLYFYNKYMYLSGNLQLNVYHNPTILLLKPIALLSFFLISDILENYCGQVSYKKILFCMILILLSIIAKPSYIIVLLPSLFILFCYGKFFRRYSTQNWKGILASLFISSIFALAIQFLMMYTGKDNGIGVGIFVFQTHFVYGWEVPISFLCSILFSISLLFFIDNLKIPLSYIFGLILMIVGAIYTYFFYESGERLLHGNFGWSGVIANFLFFYASVQLYISAIYNPNVYRKGVFRREVVIFSGGILCMFFISGIIYYTHVLMNGNYM